MRRFFYLRLAAANLKRSREVCLPHFIATAVISMVYFLVLAMIGTPGLANLPNGEIAQQVFAVSIVVFSVFAVLFMLYVNSFLIKRRKREFGLYGVLGLEKRHVSRVLMWENFFTLGAGVLAGILVGCVLGRLLFMALLNLLHEAVEGSYFVIPATAFIGTALLFFIIFLITGALNTIKVRMANPIELLNAEKKGDKSSKLSIPIAIIGAVLLGGSYYLAITVTDQAVAVAMFFVAVFAVVLATYALFASGSVAGLKLLKGRKKLYYKLDNFIAISGMTHRMKQNAAGLATICILSTMLIVTMGVTSALYLGVDDMCRTQYPMDVCVYVNAVHLPEGEVGDDVVALDAWLAQTAAEEGVTLSYDASLLKLRKDIGENISGPYIIIDSMDDIACLENTLQVYNQLWFNIHGEKEAQAAFIGRFSEKELSYGNVYTYKQDQYGVVGGLLFLGSFFSVLFLGATVLIIYFKQITEGNDDKDRFAIMQKVGMEDADVKRTINKQIRWVFFLPLGGALCHTLAAGNMIMRMLQALGLTDSGITYICLGITCAMFAIVYWAVYKLTAKTYYKIVRWKV